MWDNIGLKSYCLAILVTCVRTRTRHYERQGYYIIAITRVLVVIVWEYHKAFLCACMWREINLVSVEGRRIAWTASLPTLVILFHYSFCICIPISHLSETSCVFHHPDIRLYITWWSPLWYWSGTDLSPSIWAVIQIWTSCPVQYSNSDVCPLYCLCSRKDNVYELCTVYSSCASFSKAAKNMLETLLDAYFNWAYRLSRRWFAICYWWIPLQIFKTGNVRMSCTMLARTNVNGPGPPKNIFAMSIIPSRESVGTNRSFVYMTAFLGFYI